MDHIDPPHFKAGEADYTISEAQHDSLWRAYYAVTLLAALNNDLVSQTGITADSTAAVADYVREALLEVVLHAQRIHPGQEETSTAPNDLL
ncbi:MULTISPECIES: hypothetical protein [Xanthomonas]|uniref:Uncharacterized protein n=1 Tax=Xanthomonas axonopodis pv. melhusii TaxID=487834 RepID=A0A1T1P8K3_9XANT|nr:MULTISPECIES: hypothetical protein [Xanthomonas]MCC4607285.1 hypothetical protein [Xanthomonas campestris pv. zinniae]MBE0315944.1 hypothetical protein [Xanthomonas citri pv. punicae]MDS0760267.1 hypothetical protein [Xanthomonas citri pv. punicae]MDS0764046.1 hypothetical protein [Xanthomonas citri pv. punicae]MDS0798817.1 hypothetical protein [Xanthomonas citri pv. punicae]